MITFSICTKLDVVVTREMENLRYWGGLQVQKERFYHHFTKLRTHLEQVYGGSILASGGQNEPGKKI